MQVCVAAASLVCLVPCLRDVAVSAPCLTGPDLLPALEAATTGLLETRGREGKADVVMAQARQLLLWSRGEGRADME